MLTLRQIEIIRTILITGTVKGAAEVLGISAPGISRVMKHTESQLGLRLFARAHGRFVPTDDARSIFNQINEVFTKVEHLQDSIGLLKRGENRLFAFASVPSIGQRVLPLAVRRLKNTFPDLRMSINQVKIEESVDYLLLRRGELVANSYKLDHPGLISQPIGTNQLVALIPEGHPLECQTEVAIEDMATFPMIGIAPTDPYGEILARPLANAGLTVDFTIEARLGQTLISLVAQGLGVAVIDAFSVLDQILPGIAIRPLAKPVTFRNYAIVSAEAPRSIFADALIKHLQTEMGKVTLARLGGYPA